MGNLTHIFLLLLFPSFCLGQNAIDDINGLEGVWVAQEYYESFQITKSAIGSKGAFYHSDPVAIRINSSEIDNGWLNVGYSVLHDHLLRPEVSKYTVRNNDTIREQGCFKVNLNQADSIGFYRTSEIYYFSYEWVSYMSWNVEENSISLYRPKNDKHEEKLIRYVQVTGDFENSYPYPNPLYYFTRLYTLTGNYTLIDSLGNIVSTDLSIQENGQINGFELFENCTAYFSTDIYCGPETGNDFVSLFEDVLSNDGRHFGYAYKRDSIGDIGLYHRRWKTDAGIEKPELSEMVFKLEKN